VTDDFKETLFLFLEKCPALLHGKNNDGLTPLLLAAKLHHYWCLPLLLDAGADAFGRDPEENSVLHYLAESMVESSEVPGQIFNRLVAAGVPVNALNQKGENILFPYCRELVSSDAHPQLTWHIDTLLNAGADAFVVNTEGHTLLHVLAEANGDNTCADGTKAFARLLDLGVDPMKEDNKQRTAVVSIRRPRMGVLQSLTCF
jgi:ankyrin repeat protein